jgi:endoglucanase
VLSLLAVAAVAVGWYKMSQPSTPNDVLNKPLYVPDDSSAARQAAAWRDSRPSDARLMERLARIPTAKWFGGDASFEDMRSYSAAAKTKGQVAVVVLYNIVHRDCGLYSAGGAQTAQSYGAFIDTFVRAIADNPTIVIVEPDSLAQLVGSKHSNCLTAEQATERLAMLRYAVTSLSDKPHVKVYMDAGNSGWVTDTEQMAAVLRDAAIQRADGFSLNVSNFYSTKDSIAYGKQLSARLDNVHFVVDTSRNGSGPYVNPVHPEYTWCNPPNRTLGELPTTDTGDGVVDAYLHIKRVGESDGSDSDPAKCFGGPKAGEWWPDYALKMLQRSSPDRLSQ